MAATGTKKLVIDFSSPQPQFEFTGSWTGKDMRIVLTHARRAYLLHNKAIRAQEATGSNTAGEIGPEPVQDELPSTPSVKRVRTTRR